LKSVLKWILRGWLAVSGEGQPPKFDNIVSALRKSTVAPCHQDEQVFDAQRTGSDDPGLRRNRAPDTPSRVQRSISSNPPAGQYSW
jgi:hypothetical protein